MIERLQDDIEMHGEVHAHVEEAGRERTVELRKGTTWFHEDAEVVTVEGSNTTHRLPFDRIMDWYLPKDYYHHEH